MVPDGERRLAAIMFTDMVGYTALTQSNEAQAMEVLQRHNRLLRPFFPRFNGKEVKAIGDSFLVEFDSALDALRCAGEIQSYLHDYNISSKEEWKITLRIGIHLGDVIHQDGDIFGDAVNIASRIEPLAPPEGVVISEQVYDQVHNKSEFPLIPMGEKSLKNVSRSIQVYSLQMPWEEETPSRKAEFGTKRIAVLPFVSLSPDPNDEYFADGLTEELITKVSLIKGLEVIARTSVMGFKKKDKKVSEIARELEVGTLLEGSVRKAGNRIRVSAQLIDARTQGHLWAENYDRDLDDIFQVQTSVAENVAGALKLKLMEGGREAEESNIDPEAYTMYLRAMQFYHEETESTYREAARLFEGAIAAEPTFARAYAGLSHACRAMATYKDWTSSLERGEYAARRALELAPGSAEAHAAMAEIHFALDRFKEGRFELERAIRINPNLFDGYYLLGQDCCTFGKFDEGIDYYRKAFALDPISVRQVWMAEALRVAGKVDEALDVLGRVKSLHPKAPEVYFAIAFCHLQREDYGRAGESIDIGLRSDPNSPHLRAPRGVLYVLSGRREEAENLLEDIFKEEAEPARTWSDAAIVYISAALGEFDKAFEALMREAELHSWYYLVRFDPLLLPLHGDPRFAEFCRKVGLPP